MKSEPGNTLKVMNDDGETPSLAEPFRTWNETRTDYPRGATVAQLFEETASLHADAVAVVFKDQRLTYAELNVRANRLAHRLRRMGVADETLVGCCLERSVELVVALIAILKAGGAYLPLDPSYPKERFDTMLEESSPAVILAPKSLGAAVLAGTGARVLHVGELEPASSREDDANPARVGGPSSLAYVMYTSGSTGRPKGVMIENRSIVRLVRNTNWCRFGSDEVFLLFAPVSFDASTFEIWGPLLNGGRLIVMPPETSSLTDLGSVIRGQGVTTLWLTSGLFSLMVEERLDDLQSVRQLVAGGDVLSPRHVRMVVEKLPDCALINGYGPTENTTFTCCHRVQPEDRFSNSVPIGRPIANTRVYLLDEQRKPVAPGEAGELYAGGDGVARGYLHNSEETAERFLPDPFSVEPVARMYRTGDLARWRADGVIEFLGRLDQQVKILGHRIEPGEIEAVLTMHPGVKHVVVVPHAEENATKRLVAYYAPSSEAGPSPRDLQQFLQRKLPPYMIPALFVQLNSFPLSPNGKVDRAALPAPKFESRGNSISDDPSSEIDRTLADLWRRILRVERVGLDDNFFDMGGDSLLLVAVHSNLQKMLQMEIAVTDLFEFTTIRTLGRHLREKKEAQAPSFQAVQQQGQKQRQAFSRERERHKRSDT
jgi:amino acid adenylation domain-containing protein